MSTIGVKYHDEDIHNIIRKPMSPTVKSPRYVSRRLTDLNENKRKYNGHQTFGLAHYEAPESKNFLRKGKPRILPPTVKLLNKKEFKCTINCKSSPLPKCSFENRKQARKNFVKENIKKIAAIEPKAPVPRKVETPRGTTKELAHLLQMIKIRESEEYGRIPKYLCERRKKWAKEKERREMEQQAVLDYKRKMGIGTMGMNENVYMVDEETRQKLLDGLKENWNELSKHFLKLPVMTDTWPKIKKKMWLEKEIEQLEKDVKLVESHPYIYLERFDKRPFKDIVLEQLRKEKEAKKVQKKEEETQDKEPEPEPEPEPETKEEETPESPREQIEEIPEDKKDEDTEINILNY